MTSLSFKPLHESFVAEVSHVQLRSVHDSKILLEIRNAMNEFGVLVFRNQTITQDEQLDFAKRFDGQLHSRTSTAVLNKNRFGNEALSDISNVGADGNILPENDRRRVSSLANRLWHTDASFVSPAGRYSILSARVIPPVRADTEFADMRAAYAALDEEMKERIENLQVLHSIAYSREVLGFEFDKVEREKLKGAIQPLVRTIPGDPRKSLYLASHASSIEGMILAESRLLLRELMEHATQKQFVYVHEWKNSDLVIWDNRTTMHRGRAFDDRKYRRELIRTTTLDIEHILA
jgi:alpha-ketoglutarate-dependent 2,4-dichlorophenoxyacetate dioxygenase